MGDRLAGRIALVTGAASGLGFETAKTFAAEGAHVVAIDLDAGAVEKRLSDAGVDAFAVAANVADEAAVAQAVQSALARFGRIDVLVNFAGITRDAMHHKMTLDQFETVLRVNLTGAFLIARAVAAQMVQQQSGSIVLIASRAAYGNVGQSNYSASKGGVISLTRTLALELGRFGVRVNAIAPGFIETPMTSVVPDKVRERASQLAPLGRIGAPSDIARVALFLASEAAAFMTGQTLNVDGGRSVGLA
ncbi:MAG: glucose 1-dehydrogenase [Candidatus Eremiobacteraeota bacterium]|nr:glucose 1-dehydrogenase [Candidatus Eremiobacteraeota bacterium]